MSERAQRLAERLAEASLDAILVGERVNVRYLTGFTGSNGVAVVGPGRREFLTDFRYVEQAAAEVDGDFTRRTVSQELLDAVAEVLPDGELRLGFEDTHMSVRQHARLAERLGARVQLVGVDGLVEKLRAIKDEAEVARIAEATALADAAFDKLISDGLIGRTERELALALEQDMRLRGAQRPSFDTIVASGAHGALPHATPRDVEVRRGDLVVIDWGAELDGYCSDCTRTVAAGEPSDEAQRVYATVLEAQLAGVEAVQAGAGGRAVDAAARAQIDAAGHGEHFGHGLGHGVGLEIHEAPRLSQRSNDTLAAGNIVTVEPGIYLPGRLGVRTEDLVVVRDGGCEILTGVSKEMKVVH